MVATDGPPTTLILCRHGESRWNVERRIQGQSPTAPGLTEHGRWQASRLCARLAQFDVDSLYTSDLQRALETADVVAETLGLRIGQDPRWREVDLGRWQGLTGAQVRERWPEEIAAIEQGDDVPRGGGESYAQVQQRTVEAVQDLVARHPGETVCVVTHGGPIRLLIAAVEGYPLADLRQRAGPIGNTSLTVVEAFDGFVGLRIVADTSHLDGVEGPGSGSDDDAR